MIIPYSSKHVSDEVNTGNIFGFPLTYAPRGDTLQGWDGLLQDGSAAPAGRYKLVVRALRIFGDANAKAQYDVQETVPFVIQYK